MSKPWDAWIPGILTDDQVNHLVEQGAIENASTNPDDYDYSSFDLRLADEGYELTSGCVKPFGGGYLSTLKSLGLIRQLAPDTNSQYVLSARHTYLFRLMERIHYFRGSPIAGQATAKSSVGRMDVLARLVVDGMDEYEGFTLGKEISGDLFIEVTPMTFNVVVRPGISLTQLRLCKGPLWDSRIRGESITHTVLLTDQENQEGTLSVDLTTTRIAGHPASVFATSVEVGKGDPIPLWREQGRAPTSPCQYWQLKQADSNRRLRIEKERFYIIRSYERIWLPPQVAVYCRASDETIGEMRIHYAGFVHPFFGARDDGEKGTPLIFEVRGHDIDVSLRHQEKMARLEFYRMSQDCKKTRPSSYGEQSLQLSKYFASWPDHASCSADGTITPIS